MANRSSQGLRFLTSQLIGYDVLQWAQDEVHERANWLRMMASHEAGWVAEQMGPMENSGWTLEETSRLLSIGAPTETFDFLRPDGSATRPFIGVNRNGEVLEVLRGPIYDDAGAQVEVPDDGVWYTLLARYATDTREPGSLELTAGSPTIIGVGTQFTRYAQAGDPGGATSIQILSADTGAGNELVTTFATITDDENATLADAAPGSTETGVRFRARGSFLGGVPADSDIHRNPHVVWELVPRTTTRPTDGALIAWDVRSVVGVVSMIDRRLGSVFTPFVGTNPSYSLVKTTQRVRDWEADNYVDPFDNNIGGGVAGGEINGVSIAPAATGGQIAGYTDDGVGLIMCIAAEVTVGPVYSVKVREFSTATGWDDPNSGGPVTVVTGAAVIRDVAVIAMPEGSGFTHACFYVSDGDLHMKTSATNGATWVGPTIVLVAGGMHRVSACLTRMGRIVILTRHFSAPYIRVVFSDDLGATFDVDAGDGYDFGDGDAETRDVAVTEDDRGNLWVVETKTEVADNPVWLYRGQAEGNPIPAAPGAGKPIGMRADFGEVYSAYAPARTWHGATVDAVGMADGHVVVLADVFTTGTRGNRAWLILAGAERNNLGAIMALRAADVTGSDRRAPVGLGLMANGELMAVTTVLDGVNRALHMQRYAAAATRRPHVLYGYRP